MVGRDGIRAELVFAICTDLGDKFLWPTDPVTLGVKAHIEPSSIWDAEKSCSLSTVQWSPGKRIVKQSFMLPRMVENAFKGGKTVSVSISPDDPTLCADGVRNIIRSSVSTRSGDGSAKHGLILPVWVGLSGPSVDGDACLRRILLAGPSARPRYLEIGEEIGESIARHIWDAGLVSLCAIAGAFEFPELETSQSSCMTRLLGILNKQDGVNVLELGCGVGILGIGLSAVYPRGVRECTILMTDLGEAEARARSNVGLLRQQRFGSDRGYAQVLYENLDWESGQQGRFGSRVQDRRWDLIMLSDCTYNADSIPALVGTLSALHRLNLEFPAAESEEPFSTKVFVATKPRHDDELVLFGMMADERWTMLDKLTLPLPVLDTEPERVEMYLFEKV
ncbi:hypothetical protein UVI_02001890 [Ustilaginoidea virens]|nr:hypothetical protein UVI_02001890 [Ustilaginoidea virens]